MSEDMVTGIILGISGAIFIWTLVLRIQEAKRAGEERAERLLRKIQSKRSR